MELNLMEKLEVENFLVIKTAKLDIKKINILIGPQANGKSILAKLTYFFQNLSKIFLEGISSNKSKTDLNKSIVAKFETNFPRYSWEGTNFKIDYQINELNFRIEGIKGSRGKTNIKITYSDALSKLFSSKKQILSRKLDAYKTSENPKKATIDKRFVFFDVVLDPLRSENFSYFFDDPIFIPASRSFFANLQKNIFTFLASNLDIDPFLKEFGGLYETSKRFYNNKRLFEEHKNTRLNLIKSFEEIINGKYEYDDEQDWIRLKNNRINLANASSGQQESLPMLLVLCMQPLLLRNRESMIFIEEPEAHLFPTSQGKIVSILSILYNEIGSRFFITSHSPYILSALNNFILAGDAVKSGTLKNEEFTEINKSGIPIRFEDISAYTIKNGTLESILDNEYRLIGSEMLDEISDHFEDVTNTILSKGH
ncbi:AAA family ATPase [Marinomonas sp. FW-1]|uniref:AAA family ATPase n=1 Tax=Marinomonas sp. FW-1 TaxID=2071621 RepID=UPI0010C01424|nr:AAA family ATPase [Marinomonas sp. FW-1]